MNDEMRKRIRILCEEAGTEQDPERLMELVREIDRILIVNKDDEAQPADLDKAV